MYKMRGLLKNGLRGCFKYLAVLLMLYPVTGLAHVKWFVSEGHDVMVSDNNGLIYLSVWAVIAAGIVVAGIGIEKKIMRLFASKVYNASVVFENHVASLFSILVGVYFLAAAYYGFLFSINLDNVGQWHAVLIGVQAFVGVSFVLGIGVRQSAALFLVLWLFSLMYVGALGTLENMGLCGIAIFILIYGRSSMRYTREDIAPIGLILKGRQYAVPVLRVIMGLNLVLLGFSEKILRPDLGLAFLEQHSWNFMKNNGVQWFSDYLFVVSAGAVEIILGLVLMLGIVTRVCAAVIAIVLLIPPFFMGPSELLGHIPHLAVTAVLILFGAGDSLKLLAAPKLKQENGAVDIPAQWQLQRGNFANNIAHLVSSNTGLDLKVDGSIASCATNVIKLIGLSYTPLNKSRIPYLAAAFSGKNIRRSKRF